MAPRKILSATWMQMAGKEWFHALKHLAPFPCSDTHIGSDGATSLAAPLGKLVALQTLSLRCHQISSELALFTSVFKGKIEVKLSG